MLNEQDKVRRILINRDQYDALVRDLGFLLLARLTSERRSRPTGGDMTPTPTAGRVREVRTETRVCRAQAKIRRLRLRAMNPTRTTEERAAANAEANRVANVLRDRR